MSKGDGARQVVRPCGQEQEKEGEEEKKRLAGRGIKICLFGNQQTMR